jgi:hypothetical protein
MLGNVEIFCTEILPSASSSLALSPGEQSCTLQALTEGGPEKYA